jgi:transketolase
MVTDVKCINTIRFLAADAIEKANSGHPGTPLGITPMAYVLWTRFLRHCPTQIDWANRDRFVLSSGHSSSMLYAFLHLTGYDLSLEDIKNFRQLDSRTPGHPEIHHVPGVETTTGPLGQGFSNAVGMAIAEAHLASVFNKPDLPEIVDHYTYVITSDGDLMEGVTSEAASLAGHLRLGKLICLYDDNQITIEGSTRLAFSEDVLKRFEAYGWHVQSVKDGNDIEKISEAVRSAKENDGQPSLIAIRTIIGFGTPTKAGTSSAHAGALGKEEISGAKHTLGWPTLEPFHIPEDVKEYFDHAKATGEKWFSEWQNNFQLYQRQYPQEAKEFERMMKGEMPSDWEDSLPSYYEPGPEGIPTRMATGDIINAIESKLPELIGGAADLAPATQTLIKNSGDFSATDYSARNLRFGVREHAMAGITNGLTLHGGVLPYAATFLVFSDYMRPSLRLASMMGIREIFIFSHDSIGLGEDGPTHQPIEQIAGLRSIPNHVCIRPSDVNEAIEAWRAAINNETGPTSILLTRQAIPVLDRNKYAPAGELKYGAYVLSDTKKGQPDAILIATGSEVHPTLEAQKRLLEKGFHVRVVAMPSWELFKRQSKDYQESVLLPEVKARVAVEAGTSFGWERWVGDSGAIIGLDHFGASAPHSDLFNAFGFTAENITEVTIRVIQRN